MEIPLEEKVIVFILAFIFGLELKFLINKVILLRCFGYAVGSSYFYVAFDCSLHHVRLAIGVEVAHQI